MERWGRWSLAASVALAALACGKGIEVASTSGPRPDDGEAIDRDDASNGKEPAGDGGTDGAAPENDAASAADAQGPHCTAPDDCTGAAVCLDGGCTTCGFAGTLGLACKDGRSCQEDGGCR